MLVYFFGLRGDSSEQMGLSRISQTKVDEKTNITYVVKYGFGLHQR
jgi:hypothetical protein